MQKKHIATIFLLLLAAVASYFSFVIAQPFLVPFFLAVMLAIVFHPLHLYVVRRIRNRNIAALLSTLLTLIIFVVPCVGLGFIIRKEVISIYHWLASGAWTPLWATAMDKLQSIAGRLPESDTLDVQATILQWLQGTSHTMLVAGAHAITNIIRVIAGIVITLFSLFFLYRDGGSMLDQLAALLPLEKYQSQRLFEGVRNSILANVHGCFAVGATQGILAGLAFWTVGLESPVLWGTVTAFCSLVPVIGSATVWVPSVIILMLGGHWWKALALLIWCAVIIAQADNVVRPYVISQRAKLHPLLVFFSLLGGVIAFGPIGLFAGPVILATTLVLLEMLKEINVRFTDTANPLSDGEPHSESSGT